MFIHSCPVPHLLRAHTQAINKLKSNYIVVGVITDAIISSNNLVIDGAIDGANNVRNGGVINYVFDDVITCLSVSKHELKTDAKVDIVFVDIIKLLLDGAINDITGGADIFIYYTTICR